MLEFVYDFDSAHPWADKERHPVTTYFIFRVLGDPVAVGAVPVGEFALALFANEYAFFNIDAHLARVFGVPAHELLELAVRAGDEPVLLIAYKPIGMHARFRQARVAECVNLFVFRVLETGLIVSYDIKF